MPIVGNPITSKEIACGSISASGSFTTDPIDLNGLANAWRFGLTAIATGAGTVKAEYEVSCDGTNFETGAGGSEILTGLSGDNDHAEFDPPHARWLRLKVTETGTSAAATVTLHLSIQ